MASAPEYIGRQEAKMYRSGQPSWLAGVAQAFVEAAEDRVVAAVGLAAFGAALLGLALILDPGDARHQRGQGAPAYPQ